MIHELPALPYEFSDLEPHIDARTMEIHHGKHHNAYVTNLNAALEGHPELQDKSIEDLLKDLGAVPSDIFPVNTLKTKEVADPVLNATH